MKSSNPELSDICNSYELPPKTNFGLKTISKTILSTLVSLYLLTGCSSKSDYYFTDHKKNGIAVANAEHANYAGDEFSMHLPNLNQDITIPGYINRDKDKKGFPISFPVSKKIVYLGGTKGIEVEDIPEENKGLGYHQPDSNFDVWNLKRHDPNFPFGVHEGKVVVDIDGKKQEFVYKSTNWHNEHKFAVSDMNGNLFGIYNKGNFDLESTDLVVFPGDKTNYNINDQNWNTVKSKILPVYFSAIDQLKK